MGAGNTDRRSDVLCRQKTQSDMLRERERGENVKRKCRVSDKELYLREH